MSLTDSALLLILILSVEFPAYGIILSTSVSPINNYYHQLCIIVDKISSLKNVGTSQCFFVIFQISSEKSFLDWQKKSPVLFE